MDNLLIVFQFSLNAFESRLKSIDLDLKLAGWEFHQDIVREYPVVGMPNNAGSGFVDYVLFGDNGKPLAVIEAKRTSKDPKIGRQQAKLYADWMEKMTGTRPVIIIPTALKPICGTIRTRREKYRGSIRKKN